MNMMARITGIARSPGDPEVQSTGPSSLGAPDRLARGLGWFSIGLGALEILGAERLARALGLRGREWLIRAFGAREIASGMVSLSVNPHPGVASRIAGDGLDILVLLSALRRDNPRRENVEVALLAVVGITVLDVICQKGLVARHARPQHGWRDYSNRSGFPKGLATARGAARDGAGVLPGPSVGG